MSDLYCTVGIDLSLTSTGVATIDLKGSLHELVNIKTTGKKSDTLEDRQKRLYGIANQVLQEVALQGEAGEVLVVIEAPSYGSRFGSAHDRSGLWWLVVNALMHDGYAVAMVAPQTRAKYGTGAGNAKKDVVFAHVKDRYQSLFNRAIKNDDEADAILLAAMGARRVGVPCEPVEPPDRNLEALDAVLWPIV